jgi:hypothetical protein
MVIGANSNIQDGVVIHSKSGAAATIGRHTSIAHRPIVIGPCHVGDGCVVRHNALVDGCDLPPISMSFHHPHRPGHRLGDDPARDAASERILRGRDSHRRRPRARLKAAAERAPSRTAAIVYRERCCGPDGAPMQWSGRPVEALHRVRQPLRGSVSSGSASMSGRRRGSISSSSIRMRRPSPSRSSY